MQGEDGPEHRYRLVIQSALTKFLLNGIKAQVRKMAHPNAVIQVRSGNTVIDRELMSSVSMFVIIYLVISFIFSLIYSIFGFDLLESIGISIAMMSNVGPAFGSVGTMANFAAVPALAKFIMGLQMIIGRLGVYSILMVFTLFGRRH